MTNIIKDLRKLTESVLKTIISILNIAKIDTDNSDKSKFRVKINDSEIDIAIPAYYLYVDSGRKAGKMPPVEPIKQWIIRNKIRLPNGMKLDQYAFLIARIIGRKGVKARPFIDDVLEEIAELTMKNISDNISF